MRKVLIVLALTAVTVMASAGDAFAQRRGGGGYRGNGGYRGGSGTGIYIGNGGVRVYSGNSYGRGYYGPYVAPYYGANYYYADPIVQVPITEVRESFYEPAASQQTATMVVLVPRADAKVWVDGAATSQQGMERTFNSPPLDPGTYIYTIRARWTENGQAIERERRVNVQPGQSVKVNFRVDSGEYLQTLPRSK